MRTGIIFAGKAGSGKTATAVSYVPDGFEGTPKRIVIDMEIRAARYQSSSYGLTGDHPNKLLFDFDIYPDTGDTITQAEFMSLWRDLKAKKIAPNVIVIDNITLFQTEMQGWCQTAESAGKLVDLAGIRPKFALFLASNFRVGEPNHWKLMKSIIKAFLLDCKKAGADFVVTTEMANVWKDYGKRGRDTDGNPFQQILGQTAAQWECWEQMADVIWNLSRTGKEGKVLTAPILSQDRFHPKCSIVGVPPVLQFTNWGRIWELARERGVPTETDMGQLEPLKPEFSAEAGEPDPLEEGIKRLNAELVPAHYTSAGEVAYAMKQLKLTYSLDAHDDISAKLIARAADKKKKEK